MKANRRLGRVLVGIGIALMAVAVLRMNARALGGPPDDPKDFAERRTDRQVRREVHAGFAEFVVTAGAGFLVMLVGAHQVGQGGEDS